jgi:hypothetical protein
MSIGLENVCVCVVVAQENKNKSGAGWVNYPLAIK